MEAAALAHVHQSASAPSPATPAGGANTRRRRLRRDRGRAPYMARGGRGPRVARGRRSAHRRHPLAGGTRATPPGGDSAATASLWLAGATAWYASDWALATALPASMATLAMLALVTARRIGMRGLAEVGSASVDALRALPAGIADAARTPVHAVGSSGRGHFFGVLRGALIGVPLAGFFTLLLSADGRFRHALGRMVDRSGEGLELAVWTVATSTGLLVAYTVLSRLQRREQGPFVAVPAAWLAIPVPRRGRCAGPAPTPRTGPRVRTLTWGVVLAHIVAVFGVYVVANAGTLFVGHAHVRARGTVTYAEYLHEGSPRSRWPRCSQWRASSWVTCFSVRAPETAG